MDENINKSASKKIRPSASSKYHSPKNFQSNFVVLVNNLNSQIRKYYQSTKFCLNKEKENNNKNNVSSLQTYNLINKYLEEFILKVKDIFKRMKYLHKINLIQQEINNNENTNDDYILHKSDYDTKLINKENLYDEEVNVPSLFNSNNNSFNFNHYFHKKKVEKKNLLDKKKRKDIKSLSNSFKDIKLINKYNDTFNNEIMDKNHNSFSKIIFDNYSRKYNNLKRISNIKSVINLRKKIIFDKKADNSSLVFSSSNGLSNINSNFNSNNNSKNNLFQSKKEIFDNLNVIISLLKELKSIKGEIFNKSIEGEKYKKFLKKIYNEFIILIKNIFKENNITKNSSSELFDKYDKLWNTSNNYNLIYNNKIFNNNESNDNKNINYKKEIKHRDLIIQQLKNELNIKSQKKFSQKNLNINNNSNSFKEENIKKNKTKKIINELQEKIDKNQKRIINYPNSEQNIEKINQKYLEMEKEREKILLNNEELKNQIIKLKQELDIAKKNICINPIFKDLIVQKFSLDYLMEDTIGEKAKKIIEELNEGINNYQKENNKEKEKILKLNDDINRYKEETEKLNEENNKYKEEISQLNQKCNEFITENSKLKKNIDELNINIEKYKKLILYQ